MLFASLHERLIAHVRAGVRSGELTERGLARLTGMSQPHMNNELKGARTLSAAYADRLISHLNLSIFDLLEPAESASSAARPSHGGLVQVPRLNGQAGPFDALEQDPSPGDVQPVTRAIAGALGDPVLLTLGHDPALTPHFLAGDLALVDRTRVTAASLDNNGVYLIRTEAGNSLVRSVRVAGARLYLITPATLAEPRKWSFLEIRGGEIGDLIQGKVEWIWRKLSGVKEE